MTDGIRSPIQASLVRGRARVAVLIAHLSLACGSATPGTTSPDLSPSPSGDASLAGTDWVLTELRGQAPLGEAEITLVVEDSTAGGFSGCNHYGGTPTVTADTFRLDEIRSTLMACMDTRIMDQESEYLALLAETSVYEVADDALVLETARGESLVFRARN
jgi:heat shock protein HslJ